jgi:hypothetical protein
VRRGLPQNPFASGHSNGVVDLVFPSLIINKNGSGFFLLYKDEASTKCDDLEPG